MFLALIILACGIAGTLLMNCCPEDFNAPPREVKWWEVWVFVAGFTLLIPAIPFIRLISRFFPRMPL
jgi:hypothetical protein